MPVVVIEHTVAVEKDGRTLPPARDLMLRANQRFGDPDVDEISIERHPREISAMSEKRQNIQLERAAWSELVDQGTPIDVDAAIHEHVSRVARTLAKLRNPISVNFDHSITRCVCKAP